MADDRGPKLSDALRWLALLVFLLVAGSLFNEHREHILAAVPYLSLFVCIALVVLVWRTLRLRRDAGASAPIRSANSEKGRTSHES